jgi:hypothetical protein
MASAVSSRLISRNEPLWNRNNKASNEEPVVEPKLDAPASYDLSSVGAIRFARR